MLSDPKDAPRLRQKAENSLLESTEKPALTSGTDIEALVQELSVHQIELEMQNEELRNSRELLEQSRSEYAELYDFAPIGYLTLDKAGLITRVNLTACGLLGIERSRLIGKPFALFIHPEFRDIFHLHRQKTFEATNVQICRLSLKRNDGSFFDAQIESIAAQVDGQSAVNVTLTDITERVQAENALRESDRRLELALSSMHMGIWELNVATDEVFRSPESYEILGLKATDTTFESFVNLLHPEDAPRVVATIRQMPKDHPEFRAEFRIIRPDGAVRSLANTGRGYFDKKGALVRVIGTLQDITERKAEEALRRYELLFQNSRDIVLLIHRDNGKILEANAAAVNAYGYSRDEILKLTMGDVHAKGVSRLTDDQMMQADEKGILFETTHRRKDGSTFPVEVSSQGVTIDGTRALISLIRDVTERKTADEALRKAHNELEFRVQERTAELQEAYDRLREETREREQLEGQLRQAQKMEALGTLSGGIAHDFNNILAAIIGFTDIVAGHTDKGSRDALRLQRVIEAGIRGRELVRQMLTFSRKTDPEKKLLHLDDIVEETVRLIRASIPATIGIRVKTSNESDLILADPTQMQQVIINLCTNAAYAMRESGGVLDIRLSDHSVSPSNNDPHGIAPGRYVKLSVGDTGIGMSGEIMEKIFDPFFTTKGLGEGTGLGLSVVHGIVKQHDGYITVISEPGKGSVFTAYFPGAAGNFETGAANGDEIPTGCERILFVDDEEALVEMGEDILTELGYEVTSRTSSKEALALVKLDPSRFDLVITDQTMPEMTGVELARKILIIRADMPIIMCTGFSYTVNAETAREKGVKAFAMKPLTKRELAKTIRKVLDE